MVVVQVTIAQGRKTVRLEDITDGRIAAPIRQAASQVGKKLAKVKCTEHGKGPTNVRLHFDAKGEGDLKFDSCCGGLAVQIGEALG
jgi:hypothetical protein